MLMKQTLILILESSPAVKPLNATFNVVSIYELNIAKLY